MAYYYQSELLTYILVDIDRCVFGGSLDDIIDQLLTRAYRILKKKELKHLYLGIHKMFYPLASQFLLLKYKQKTTRKGNKTTLQYAPI